MTDAPLLQLRGVSKSFGPVTAVEHTDLSIEQGDFFALLGPSGCGKTTLLRVMGGFVSPTRGSVWIGGADVTRHGPEHRPTNMVFQRYGLFSHMTVRQNVAYGLQIQRLAKSDVAARTRAVLELVQMEHYENESVTHLSGGQQQRVALARALVMGPKVLLLDEPLAALDLKLRRSMHVELRRIHKAIGGTFVLVSHDQGEVMSLASRVAVMDSGRIAQEGRPKEVYQAPASRYVATFLGEANLLEGERRGGVITLAAGASFPHDGPDGTVTVVVRPEQLELVQESAEDIAIAGMIRDIIYFGSHVELHVRLTRDQIIVAQVQDSEQVGDTLRDGSRVTLWWRPDPRKVLKE
ncbi:MAG: ABC transporter ATP-binding protein [Gammaproteobacteria bacterium]|nr:ABC transporter ATP-binding protein [Gammaproteobacteria bacterium]